MKKFLVFLTLIFLGIGIAYHFLDLSGPKTSPVVLTQESSGHADNFADSESPLSQPNASRSQAASAHSIPAPAGQFAPGETLPLLEAILNQPVSIEHGGPLRELALAKDELYVRNSDGVGRVVSIPSASNASELLGQIEKLQKENGSTPDLSFILPPPLAMTRPAAS